MEASPAAVRRVVVAAAGRPGTDGAHSEARMHSGSLGATSLGAGAGAIGSGASGACGASAAQGHPSHVQIGQQTTGSPDA